MLLKIQIENLSSLFEKAKENYFKCIENDENQFLSNEINLPLTCIELVRKEIKFILLDEHSSKYSIEISLSLYNFNKKLGEYIFIEDELGNEIEDFLIFY